MGKAKKRENKDIKRKGFIKPQSQSRLIRENKMSGELRSTEGNIEDETENGLSFGIIDSGQSNQRSIEEAPPDLVPEVPTLTIRDDYPRRDEKFYDRLSTYENFPYPDACPIPPEALAKAGFRYTGITDMVICDYCNGRLQRWEETDEPLIEHDRHYPDCQFLLPLKQLPINPQYDTAENRLESFDSEIWRRRENEHCPPADLLANAGFYFVGGLEQVREVAPDAAQVRPTYRNDATKCFHCNVTLHSWELNDDVWVEHARWSSKCGFLIAQCGLDFVRQQVPIQDEPELSLTSRFAGIDVTDTPIHVQRNRQLRSTKKEL